MATTTRFVVEILRRQRERTPRLEAARPAQRRRGHRRRRGAPWSRRHPSPSRAPRSCGQRNDVAHRKRSVEPAIGTAGASHIGIAYFMVASEELIGLFCVGLPRWRSLGERRKRCCRRLDARKRGIRRDVDVHAPRVRQLRHQADVGKRGDVAMAGGCLGRASPCLSASVTRQSMDAKLFCPPSAMFLRVLEHAHLSGWMSRDLETCRAACARPAPRKYGGNRCSSSVHR